MTDASSTSYLLLGSGRLARHLGFYFRQLNLPLKTWSRREQTAAQLVALAETSSHILFAVSDGSIAELSRPFSGGGKTLVHFSGATQVDGVHAAHPLMTFGAELQSLESYKRIPFIHDADVSLRELLPDLPNAGWALAPELRPLYHALCTLAGNSAYLLWSQIGAEFERTLGLPRELLQPFLHQTVTNAGASEALNFTGPVARGDWQTVRRHLEALPPPLAQAYQSFLSLARGSGYALPEVLQ